jgi:hypothetical protein
LDAVLFALLKDLLSDLSSQNVILGALGTLYLIWKTLIDYGSMIAICIVSFRVELPPINLVFFLPIMFSPSVALAVPFVALAIAARVAFSLR